MFSVDDYKETGKATGEVFEEPKRVNFSDKVVRDSLNHEFVPDDSLSVSSGPLHHSPDLENPNDGAENLVRSEARAVRFLRVAVIILLVIAAALTGTYAHRLSAKNQIDSFTRDFQDLAARFINQFESGVGSYLYQSYTLSEAITNGFYAGSTPTFPYVTLADMDTLAFSLRLQARALDIVWSPLLKTRREKNSWEKYAANNQQNSNSSSTGQNQACFLCGEGNEIINPNNQIPVPGVGTFTCQSVQQAAVTGFLTDSECSESKPQFPAYCGCQKAMQLCPSRMVLCGV
jgi:hypothetical protein